MKAIIYLFVITIMLMPGLAAAMATIRDAETESVIRECIRPVLAAADFPENALNVIIVNDNSLNAFVAGGTNIFINTGLIVEMEHPDMLQGVAAHELGHISGGHLTKMSDALSKAAIQQGVTTLISIAAAAAGQGELGKGVMAAGSQMAQSGLMSFSRTQEQAADQAGLTYLERANISSNGMLDTLDMLRQRERLSPNDSNAAYIRSHPLTIDRMAHIRNYGETHKITRADSKSPLVQKFARVRAKLRAFLEPMERVKSIYKYEKTPDARYAVAIMHFRASEIDQALKLIDDLIKEFPDDGFFHEMKGQMLFENGRIKEAISSYNKAHTLLPDEPLISLSLAQAILAEPNSPKSKEAATLLLSVTSKEPDNSFAWKLLGQARKNIGDESGAIISQAEEAFINRRYKDALRFAGLAKKNLAAGSPQYLRAEDIERFAQKAITPNE